MNFQTVLQASHQAMAAPIHTPELRDPLMVHARIPAIKGLITRIRVTKLLDVRPPTNPHAPPTSQFTHLMLLLLPTPISSLSMPIHRTPLAHRKILMPMRLLLMRLILMRLILMRRILMRHILVGRDCVPQTSIITWTYAPLSIVLTMFCDYCFVIVLAPCCVEFDIRALGREKSSICKASHR